MNTKLISIHEAAEQLGVVDITVHRMAKKGTLASVKIGRRRMIPLAALERLVASAMEGMSP